MVATAPLAQRWLAIEHNGPWPVEALEAFPPPVATAIGERAEGEQARVALVRRPGRRPAPAAGVRYLVADLRPGHEGLRWAQAASAEAIATADWTVQAGEGDPVALVCAHGRHDVCCALRGRPAAAALEQRWPGRVWECSHLGGDRFAATLVLLPHGLYYGRVDDASGAAVLAAYDRGEVEPAHLRGRTALPRLAQAAQAAARESGQVGPELDAGLPRVVRDLGAGLVEVLLIDPDVRVVLRERVEALDTPATCRSSVAAVGYEYDVVSIA
jgi:hypothetical protein